MTFLTIALLLLTQAAYASSLSEIKLNTNDSIKFFNRLQSLAQKTGDNQYKLNFLSEGSGFSFNCDATVQDQAILSASCVANFKIDLSDNATTIIVPGKMSNTLFAIFKTQSDNLKLKNIRLNSRSGLGTSETRVLAYLRTSAYEYPRFVINCDKAGESGNIDMLLQPDEVYCWAMAVEDCNSIDCGKRN